MTPDTARPPAVLRGIGLDRAPLRLGRAAAPAAATAAAQVLVEQAAPDEDLRQVHALARTEGREEGLRCGREQGLREGRQHAEEEIRQAVQRAVAESEREWNEEHERLRRIVHHARCGLADLVWSAQEHMVALCYETLCRVLGATATQPGFLQGQISHLLEQHGAPDVVLHVHPQDAVLLQRTGTGAPAMRVVPDAGVALGGCILASGSGALDARLDSMLESCKAALLEARAEAVQESSRQEDA